METGVIDVLDLKRGKTRQDGIKAIGQNVTETHKAKPSQYLFCTRALTSPESKVPAM